MSVFRTKSGSSCVWRCCQGCICDVICYVKLTRCCRACLCDEHSGTLVNWICTGLLQQSCERDEGLAQAAVLLRSRIQVQACLMHGGGGGGGALSPSPGGCGSAGRRRVRPPAPPRHFASGSRRTARSPPPASPPPGAPASPKMRRLWARHLSLSKFRQRGERAKASPDSLQGQLPRSPKCCAMSNRTFAHAHLCGALSWAGAALVAWCRGRQGTSARAYITTGTFHLGPFIRFPCLI